MTTLEDYRTFLRDRWRQVAAILPTGWEPDPKIQLNGTADWNALLVLLRSNREADFSAELALVFSVMTFNATIESTIPLTLVEVLHFAEHVGISVSQVTTRMVDRDVRAFRRVNSIWRAEHGDRRLDVQRVDADLRTVPVGRPAHLVDIFAQVGRDLHRSQESIERQYLKHRRRALSEAIMIDEGGRLGLWPEFASAVHMKAQIGT